MLIKEKIALDRGEKNRKDTPIKFPQEHSGGRGKTKKEREIEWEDREIDRRDSS